MNTVSSHIYCSFVITVSLSAHVACCLSFFFTLLVIKENFTDAAGQKVDTLGASVLNKRPFIFLFFMYQARFSLDVCAPVELSVVDQLSYDL